MATEVAGDLRWSKRNCDDDETMFKQLKSYTVQKLKAYLQFKGLQTTGRKDDLITRVKTLFQSTQASDSESAPASDSESAPVPKS